MYHHYAKHNCNTGLSALQSFLRRLHLLQPPVGTTLGPIQHTAISEGPYRKQRRANKKSWLQGLRIATRRNITLEELIKAIQDKTHIPYHKKPRAKLPVGRPVPGCHVRSLV